MSVGLFVRVDKCVTIYANETICNAANSALGRYL